MSPLLKLSCLVAWFEKEYWKLKDSVTNTCNVSPSYKSTGLQFRQAAKGKNMLSMKLLAR